LGIDAVESTDGIDVTTTSLGPAFPNGVFVAHDGHDDEGNQNYKLVPWRRIFVGG
jgi:3-phytase